MLEHPPAGYPGRACLPPWGIPAPQGIGSPHEELSPTSTMLSPPRCLTANAAERKKKRNKQKKNTYRLREGCKRNAKNRFSFIKRYKKKLGS